MCSFYIGYWHSGRPTYSIGDPGVSDVFVTYVSPKAQDLPCSFLCASCVRVLPAQLPWPKIPTCGPLKLRTGLRGPYVQLVDRNVRGFPGL